ncbi:hypothetical protein DAPPUDRAFT_251946 [Daphnia pulex]|uniref:Uncharacterized protein n=1 Tax=Daphnia pulex TaxID=6669 RepID=E9H1A6_DAPPU|nr:hypothetical protein DAPPUDRAFT_251946 [Daphnia pulex]|eukprot:EFX74410.1 hypothetical protein DAPPUDRAFT_251946 [Daphnia pulex]
MESSVIIGDQHVNNANTSAVNMAAAQSFLVNQTAGILFLAVQQDQSAVASANEMVLRTSATIDVVAQQHSRCCKLTEGVYTIMGCISVTLFFLGVATIKFLGKSDCERHQQEYIKSLAAITQQPSANLNLLHQTASSSSDRY